MLIKDLHGKQHPNLNDLSLQVGGVGLLRPIMVQTKLKPKSANPTFLVSAKHSLELMLFESIDNPHIQ